MKQLNVFRYASVCRPFKLWKGFGFVAFWSRLCCFLPCFDLPCIRLFIGLPNSSFYLFSGDFLKMFLNSGVCNTRAYSESWYFCVLLNFSFQRAKIFPLDSSCLFSCFLSYVTTLLSAQSLALWLPHGFTSVQKSKRFEPRKPKKSKTQLWVCCYVYC